MPSSVEGAHNRMFFHYRFKLPNGTVRGFVVRLDKETLSLVPEARNSYPEWTRLSYYQCSNCPLKEEAHPRCPIAANLVEVVEAFRDSISHEEVDVEIVTDVRTYAKRTSLQNAISSLIGIYMVTSGCPIMDKLKPMVRTHLPFATAEETLYRAITMYLLAQYFLAKRGKQPDWKLEELVKIYDDIRIVNKSFSKRLLETRVQDATLNALVHLDCFADRTTFSLQEDQLEAFEKLFTAYLEKP